MVSQIRQNDKGFDRLDRKIDGYLDQIERQRVRQIRQKDRWLVRLDRKIDGSLD